MIQSVREVLRTSHDDLLLAEVQSVNTQHNTVHTSEGPVPYDYLVVALGAPTNFYGIKGAEQYCLKLDNLQDANEIRDACIDAFEKASKMKDAQARKKFLTFAIVGGGPTGTELAAELKQLFSDTFGKYYHNIYCAEEASVYLLQRGGELVPQFTPWIRRYVQDVLTHKGVNVLFNSTVTEVTPEGIFLRKVHPAPSCRTWCWVYHCPSCNLGCWRCAQVMPVYARGKL